MVYHDGSYWVSRSGRLRQGRGEHPRWTSRSGDAKLGHRVGAGGAEHDRSGRNGGPEKRVPRTKPVVHRGLGHGGQSCSPPARWRSTAEGLAGGPAKGGMDSGRKAEPGNGRPESSGRCAAGLESDGSRMPSGKPGRRVRRGRSLGLEGGSPGFRRGGRTREAPVRAHHGAGRRGAVLQRLSGVVRGRRDGGVGGRASPRRAIRRRAPGRSEGLPQRPTPRRARAAARTPGGHPSPKASVRRDPRPVSVRV